MGFDSIESNRIVIGAPPCANLTTDDSERIWPIFGLSSAYGDEVNDISRTVKRLLADVLTLNDF